MNRKLLLLDAVLIAAVAWAGVQLRNHWRAAQERQAAEVETFNTRRSARQRLLDVRPAVTPGSGRCDRWPADLHASYCPVLRQGGVQMS